MMYPSFFRECLRLQHFDDYPVIGTCACVAKCLSVNHSILRLFFSAFGALKDEALLGSVMGGGADLFVKFSWL